MSNDLVMQMLTLRNDSPELWRQVSDYHRWALLNDLWKASAAAFANNTETRDAVRRWLAQWLDDAEIVAGSKEQMLRMIADPEGYFRSVKIESERRMSRG